MKSKDLNFFLPVSWNWLSVWVEINPLYTLQGRFYILLMQKRTEQLPPRQFIYIQTVQGNLGRP